MPVLSRSCKQETRFKTVTGVFIFSGKANRCIACKPENLLTDYYHSSREMTAIVNNSEKDPAQAGLFCCAVSCQTVSVFIRFYHGSFSDRFFCASFPVIPDGCAHSALLRSFVCPPPKRNPQFVLLPPTSHLCTLAPSVHTHIRRNL